MLTVAHEELRAFSVARLASPRAGRNRALPGVPRAYLRRRARTAVPYAQISVHVEPSSEASNRIAMIAFTPFLSASATIRAKPRSRLSWSVVVMPLSSPPKSDRSSEPIQEAMFRERTVRPKTSP